MITSAPTTAGELRKLWRDKHDMPNLLVDVRSGSPELDVGRHRGPDPDSDDDKRQVQRS